MRLSSTGTRASKECEMAHWFTPTEKEKTGYAKWVESRPAMVREVAARFAPWILYRMKSTGHRVLVKSFGEWEHGVSLTVVVDGRFNRLAFERNVFGVEPDDLEECDLPPLGEQV